MALHVGFGGSLPEHAFVDADEGRVVALLSADAKRAVVTSMPDFGLIATALPARARAPDY